jgi:hypothetical protein
MPIEDLKARLDALAAFPALLRQQVQAKTPVELTFRPAEKEWSALEVVGHLIDSEVVFMRRIGQIISTEHPALVPFDPDAAVRVGDYQNKQLGFLLITLSEKRAATIEELRYLNPMNLARTGQHPWRGSISIDDMITIWVGHDQNHLQQINTNFVAFHG